ncbi:MULTISPECIES: histidine phosphatase family protein [unclassified Bacillus (in: firmicutes)]|uniref:histidine phosphatase family protein n=1 Tax=unclassified Bacillus (in: firmicutes) TaxID=185979 RepID=UPI000D037C42|nr:MULTISPECIES: histidine phosphatase family protein [unclassified Bacillus (in: firmicutes)]PRS82600.1 histidine phosphatase family protein [Bacillus sp. CJCL2]PRS87348.1 histidine phosphatase family protein [Bacillus sp. YBWC18]
MKTYYIVRHCQANGQSEDASLTPQGIAQSHALAQFFSDIHLNQIISSPYKRAIQTTEPLAHVKQLEVQIDQRLSERVLSSKPMDDWYEKLKLSFSDLHMTCEGGESSQEAMNRIVEALYEQIKLGKDHTLFATHGNIMSLLLKHADPTIGFKEWDQLSNPDVYVLQYFRPDHVEIERIWHK